jgi:hypothetical protein
MGEDERFGSDCRAFGWRLREQWAAAEPQPVSLCVQESPEPVGTVGGPPKLPPLTYKQARTKYMDTGTITDKEAMVDCVTMTVPDLDTIGADWEPAAAVAVPKPVISRTVFAFRVAKDFALSGTGMVIIAVQLWASTPSPVLLVIGLMCIGAGLLLADGRTVRR